jgi:glycosyltransferase involved in cell wall biosynthesis
MAQALIGEFPELLFVIAGAGPDAARLRQRTATLGLDRNVLFVGNLDRNSTLLDCYKAGDVFVFASPTETQGLVLIEAMALGVPIVSTAVMGTATVLAGTRCARISPEEVATFAGHVAALLRTPAEREALSAAGPEDARAWSAPALTRRVIDLYANLAADATSSAVTSLAQ